MEESNALARLRQIFGSDGPWILSVFAVVGLGATFVGFGWGGATALLVFILLLLVVVFARAALRPQLQTAEEPPALAQQEHPALEGGTSDSRENSSDQPLLSGEVPTTPEEDLGSDGPGSTAFGRGLSAALDNDIKVATTAFDEWIAEEADPIVRLERQAFKLFALVRAGEADALERLRELADENTRNVEVQELYIDALSAHGATQKAIDELRERLDAVADEDGRARLRLNEARLHVEMGELRLAKVIALELIESSVAFKAATMLAEIAEKEGDDFLGIAYYERALSSNPTDTGTRFKLAYAASKTGMTMLAVHHYRLLEKNGTATNVAVNNLGAALAKAGALGLSRDYWRRASNMGSSLATGNLANAAALAGFLDEAEKFIADTNQVGASPRIGEALQRIAQTREDDVQTMREMEDGGRTVSAALTRVLLNPTPSLPSGGWDIDGKRWDFEVRSGVAEATRDAGGKCRFFLDASNHLRFELTTSMYATTLSGYAAQSAEGVGLLLLAGGKDEGRERLVVAAPALDQK